jgi:hypothetical protein
MQLNILNFAENYLAMLDVDRDNAKRYGINSLQATWYW